MWWSNTLSGDRSSYQISSTSCRTLFARSIWRLIGCCAVAVTCSSFPLAHGIASLLTPGSRCWQHRCKRPWRLFQGDRCRAIVKVHGRLSHSGDNSVYSTEVPKWNQRKQQWNERTTRLQRWHRFKTAKQIQRWQWLHVACCHNNTVLYFQVYGINSMLLFLPCTSTSSTNGLAHHQ